MCTYPLQGVVSFETLTFLRTTALQRCKLINAFGGGLGRLRHSPPTRFPSVPELCHFRLIQLAAICAENRSNNSTSAAQKQSKIAKCAIARLSQMRAFFAHTSLQVVFTSYPGCFQIIMQEKRSYAHGNLLRTSHIAICEVKGNKPISPDFGLTDFAIFCRLTDIPSVT